MDRQGSPASSELNERLTDLVDSVKDLASHLGAVEQEVPMESARERAARRVKKFQRSGTNDDRGGVAPSAFEERAVDPLGKSVPVDDTEQAEAAAFNKNIAWPRLSGTDTDPFAPPRQASKRKRPNKKLVAITVYLVGIGLTALGFLGGRLTAPDTGADENQEARPNAKTGENGGYFKVSERAMQTANTALHAASTGDQDSARRIYNEALDKRVELPGIHYQLGRLAMQRGDPLDLDIELDRSSGAGEFVVASCYTRARYAGMKGSYEEASRQFQYAAHAEPFNANYFFYWGETLRRRGQTQNAVDVLQQALDRAHTAADGALFLFKQRLAKVEYGSDQAFSAELDEHLKQASPEGEWLLLSAAREIERHAFPAAAEALRKAGSALPPAAYDLRVKDYLFQTALDEPSISALLKRPPTPESTEVKGPFLDPTVLPAELADPAIWPVASPKGQGGT